MMVAKAVISCCLLIGAVASQAVLAQSPAAPAAAPQKIRVLILTGNADWSHPWEGTAPFLQGLLNNTGHFNAKLEEEVNGITSTTLANYDVLVFYYYGPRFNDVTEKAIADFVHSGKGMVCIHGDLYGPLFGQAGGSATEPRRLEGEPWQAYIDMVGMNWDIAKIGHGRRHVFTVEWTQHDSPINRDLPPTFVANDELYHMIDLKPQAKVLASALDDANNPGGTGKVEPVVWTTAYGTGRVMVTVLGHDLLAMSQPGFMDLITHGTEWAATGDVAPGTPWVSPPTSMPMMQRQHPH
jgi:type 1 glutamine amidotransferase